MSSFHSITRIVPQRQEDRSSLKLAEFYFAEAYDQLRRACPKGDLYIHLSIKETAKEFAQRITSNHPDPETAMGPGD